MSGFKVPFVNPTKQYKDHKKEFISTVDNVLSRGDLVLRGDLEEFEKKIAKLVGTKYALGVHSGTAALYLAMKAAGLGLGDEVITVAHSFIASVSAVFLNGAKPVFIDVGEDFNMNPDLIERAITEKTKAIEPVHLNGRLCDMERITAIAKRHHLLIIEDAAQALGAMIKTRNGKWKKAGSFGLAGCFSMYPFKALGAFGNAGAVTTNNAEIYSKVKLLRYNGENRRDRKFYYHSLNEPLDNLQAALLNVKLKYFGSWLKRRRRIANFYQKGLKMISSVRLPHFFDKRFFDTYQNYVIRVESRDELAYFLKKKGIETMISWNTPLYKQPVLYPCEIVLPETEKICNQVLSLPIYPELTNKQVQYIIRSIYQFYHGNCYG